MNKITKIFAEKSTPNSGLYIINENNFLYDISWKKNAIINSVKINETN